MLLHLLLRFVLDVVFACEISKDTHCVCGATSRWRLLPATRTLEACMPDLCHPLPLNSRRSSWRRCSSSRPWIGCRMLEQPSPEVKRQTWTWISPRTTAIRHAHVHWKKWCPDTLPYIVILLSNIHICFAYFRLAIHLHLVILAHIKSTWLFSQFLSVYFSVSISFSESLCGWGGFMFCGCLFGQPWR